MAWWLVPVELVGNWALTYGLQMVESKFPGSASVINGILSFLKGAPSAGVATAQLVEHWSAFPVTNAPNANAPAPKA